jgi:hypothetical protein
MSRPDAGFYRPDMPEPGWMALEHCMVLWETEPDSCGQFAVVFQCDDGRIWATNADMESHSLFYGSYLLYVPQECGGDDAETMTTVPD